MKEHRVVPTMRTIWLAVLLLTAALSGCIGSDGSDPASGTQTAAIPPVPLGTVVEQGHDHGDASLHDFGWNVERVGFHTGFEQAAGAAGGFTELAVDLPYVYLCRGGEEPGVVVLDVSTPSQPSFVDRFAMPRCDDVEVSEDNAWVFASAQRNPPGDVLMASDGPATLPRGTWVIDASDKSELAFESFYAMPYNGPHTIQYVQHPDGREIVIHNLYDLYSRLDPSGQAPAPTPGGAVPASQRVEIAEVTLRPDGTTALERIAVYSDTQAAASQPEATVMPHDATVYQNPLDGSVYMLVAYWDDGVHIVDLDDPEDPQLVSKFQDFSPSELDNIHQVRAFPTLIDGKWVLVAEPEIITAEESGQITLIDASDPSAPSKLGHWTLPGNVTIPEPFLFSPHNFDLDAEGRIYLAHQHAGVWVIDVNRTGTLQEPATVGAILPTAPDGQVPGGPRTWGVFLEDGLLYASDSPTGLHVLDYTGP